MAIRSQLLDPTVIEQMLAKSHGGRLDQRRKYVHARALTDSRAPQMMSYVAPGANKTREGKVELSGGVFVAPEWGKAKNVPFIYRLTVGEVKDNRQIVQLFLTEQSVSAKEFLAFEYVYIRRP